MPRSSDPEDVQVVVARLESIDEKIEAILVEVKRTNGRVTALETAGKVREALAAAARQQVMDHQVSRSWVPGSATTVVCVLLGILAGHFIH